MIQILAFLFPIALSGELQEGDRWTTERTIHFIQESDHVDVNDVDKLDYQVVRVVAAETTIALNTTPMANSRTKKSKRITVFHPNGTLISDEDSSNLDLERINRMEWTALEPRKALSWSRNWRASSTLVEAKVTVKPTSRTTTDTTLLVTYVEGEKTKAVATIKVFNELPVIEDLALTINNADIPGSTKPGSLIVTEKLIEIHVVGR